MEKNLIDAWSVFDQVFKDMREEFHATLLSVYEKDECKCSRLEVVSNFDKPFVDGKSFKDLFLPDNEDVDVAAIVIMYESEDNSNEDEDEQFYRFTLEHKKGSDKFTVLMKSFNGRSFRLYAKRHGIEYDRSKYERTFDAADVKSWGEIIELFHDIKVIE